MTIEEKLELLLELLTLVDLSKETTSEEVSEQADLGALCYEFTLIFNNRDCQNYVLLQSLLVCGYQLYNRCVRVAKLWGFGHLLTVAS